MNMIKPEDVKDHLWAMKLSLDQANKAFLADEVPVGAIVVNQDRQVVSEAHNLKEKHKDASAHAEILALKSAAQKLGDWRLEGHTLYVTLEPCPMCLSAISQFRVETLVFGAYDPKGGSLSLGYELFKDERLNHQFQVLGGVLHKECAKLLSDFFKSKRKLYARGSN